MPQTPERRMYLAWRAAKARHDYRTGEPHSPLMKVAVRFRVPISRVREAIETQRANPEGAAVTDSVAAGPPASPTRRCPNCSHPIGDHSVRRSRILPPRPTWCHACDAECGYEPATNPTTPKETP